MKHSDGNTSDTVPRPISSEQAQRGEAAPDPVLETPDADTEVVDKVITPTSIKEQEELTHKIKERLAEVESKTGK